MHAKEVLRQGSRQNVWEIKGYLVSYLPDLKLADSLVFKYYCKSSMVVQCWAIVIKLYYNLLLIMKN